MKTHEIQFATFLDSLKAPQCRRIVEVLADGQMTESDLVRKTKLSKKSVELHLELLLVAKVVVKRKSGALTKLSVNKKLFLENSDWFQTVRSILGTK